MITLEALTEMAKESDGEIKETRAVYFFPAITKKDKKRCKEGDGVEAASSFIFIARAGGFNADFHKFYENGTSIEVRR